MYRETITNADEITAARLANLWNEAIGDMLTGLRADLAYLTAEGSTPAAELSFLDALERTLYRLDSGEQHGGPVELRDAVQAWLAYYFRSAEEPSAANLAPVYRLAAELSDAAETVERVVTRAAPGAPTPTA
ncbi:hypothetical protein [Streptomyces sp. NPDC055794]